MSAEMILAKHVTELSTGYHNAAVLDEQRHTTIQGIPYLSTNAYLRDQSVSAGSFKDACMKAGYPVRQVTRESVTFLVPVSKVIEDCAAIAKAPKFEKIVDDSGEVAWKSRQPNRMSAEERAYLITHQDEYHFTSPLYQYGTATPKAVPTGLRAKDSSKAARSALIASFNKNMHPWIVLLLNIRTPDGTHWLGGARYQVSGFDSEVGLDNMRETAVKSMRQSREAVRKHKEFEIMCKNINVFFKLHKGKSNLEIKDIIVTKCLEKIFNNTPKYMNIHPYSVIAKALSK
jgi:hypothetical protein